MKMTQGHPLHRWKKLLGPKAIVMGSRKAKISLPLQDPEPTDPTRAPISQPQNKDLELSREPPSEKTFKGVHVVLPRKYDLQSQELGLLKKMMDAIEMKAGDWKWIEISESQNLQLPAEGCLFFGCKGETHSRWSAPALEAIVSNPGLKREVWFMLKAFRNHLNRQLQSKIAGAQNETS